MEFWNKQFYNNCSCFNTKHMFNSKQTFTLQILSYSASVIFEHIEHIYTYVQVYEERLSADHQHLKSWQTITADVS